MSSAKAQEAFAILLVMDTNQYRKDRLLKLSIAVGGHSTLGRMLGMRDGSYIGQMISGVRPITEKFISKVHSMHAYRKWFDEDENCQADEGALSGYDVEDVFIKVANQLSTMSLTHRKMAAVLLEAIALEPSECKEHVAELSRLFMKSQRKTSEGQKETLARTERQTA